MPNERILVVDDEKEINDLIRSYLIKEGFKPVSAYSGREAMDLIEEEAPDLIILDVMLPDIEGPSLSLKIRGITNAPIVFLSCKGEEMDKIVALSAGGDDYMTKPFLPGELIARIKAHLRRNQTIGQLEKREEEKSIYRYPGLLVNLQTREVMVKMKPVSLTAKEFDILALFLKSPRQIFTAEQIYEAAWKSSSLEGDVRTIMVYISNLRKKIEENPSKPNYIISVRGVGYKFNHTLLDGGSRPLGKDESE
jgi:DNA-binding response OmpR family regulator